MRLLKLLSIIFVCLGVNHLYAQTDFNLDFEQVNSAGKVRNFGYGESGYKYFLDSTVFVSGKRSLCIEYISGNQYKQTSAAFLFPTTETKGKKVKLSGYIKTDNVTNSAGFYIYFLGKDSTCTRYAGMESNGPKGTTGWANYSIELDIHKDARQLYFGLFMGDKGKAWFDNLKIEIAGVEYPQPDISKLILNENQIKWLDNNVIKFNSADPKNNNNDLQFLKTTIGTAKIAALGESTCGTSEFVKMKHRITKFLAEEMGFTVLAINADMYDVKILNNYIQTGNSNAKKNLADLNSWTFDTQEFLDMIEWMRQFNVSGKRKIELRGLDLQAETKAIESIISFIKKADPGYLDKVVNAYNTVSDACIELKVNTTLRPDSTFQPVIDVADEVCKYLISKAGEYEKKWDKNEVDWIIQSAKAVVWLIESYIPKKTSQDESMANNVSWILSQHPAETKIILWAHNDDIAKSSLSNKPMGGFLNEKYGNDFVSIGLIFHDGTYTAMGNKYINTYSTSKSQIGSIEWIFHNLNKSQLFFDSRKSFGSPLFPVFSTYADLRSIHTFSSKDAFLLIEAANVFDALIFFDNTTPTTSFRKSAK